LRLLDFANVVSRRRKNAATAASSALSPLMLRVGLSREDEIAIVFCGSKKSLVTGIPMANALFAGASVGLSCDNVMTSAPT
jgi:predicted Na+-dependent transporter